MNHLSLLLFFIWSLFSYSTSPLSDLLCKPNEEVIFSFYVEKEKKTVSICKEKAGKYLVYRYGTKDKIELEFTESLDESSWKKFIYYADVIPEPGGKESGHYDLTFNTWKYSYTISENRNGTSLDVSLKVNDYAQEEKTGAEAIVLAGTAKVAVGSLKQLLEEKYTYNHPLAMETHLDTDGLIRNRILRPNLVKNRQWKAITYYESSFPNGKEKWEKRHHYEFSSTGKLLKEEEAGTEDEGDYSRGSWRQEFQTMHLDAKGRLTEKKHFQSDSESDSTYLYSELYGYNQKGQMTTMSHKNGEGEVSLTATIRYDAMGNDIEYTDHFSKTRSTRTYDNYSRQLTNKEHRNLNELIKVDSSVYTKADNQIIYERYEKELYNGKIQTTGYSKYISDSRGKSISGLTRYNLGEKNEISSGSQYFYNSLGLLEQKQSFSQQDYKDEKRTMYFYNPKHDLIKEITYSGQEPVSGKKWVYTYY